MKRLLGCREGETTKALVCFTDIAGFARAAEALSIQSMADLLKRVSSIISRCVGKTAGTVVKYIGDASLLVFPEEETDPGLRELLAMKREIERYFGLAHPSLAITFSAHLGELIVVRLGPFPALNVLGATVNTASVLGRRTKAGGFVISRAVYERLSEETRAEFHRQISPPLYVAAKDELGGGEAG